MDKQPCIELSILRMYFHAFNFYIHVSQAVRKYFNNEILVIYGSLPELVCMLHAVLGLK